MKLYPSLAALCLMSMSGVAMAAAGKAGSGAAIPPPPPAPPSPPEFNFDFDIDMPASRAVGKSNEPSLESRQLVAMPAPNAEGKKASFLIPVTVDAAIVGDDERYKAFKAQCKTVQNRLGGVVRRLRKTDAGKGRNFGIRIVSDDKLGFGVRVWRDADDAPETAAT